MLSDDLAERSGDTPRSSYTKVQIIWAPPSMVRACDEHHIAGPSPLPSWPKATKAGGSNGDQAPAARAGRAVIALHHRDSEPDSL
jgi:hypothetical protein